MMMLKKYNEVVLQVLSTQWESILKKNILYILYTISIYIYSEKN